MAQTPEEKNQMAAAFREYLSVHPELELSGSLKDEISRALVGIAADFTPAVGAHLEVEPVDAAAQPSVQQLERQNGLVQLAQRVARLNPCAGEIGAGMLAQLVEQAKDALANTEE